MKLVNYKLTLLAAAAVVGMGIMTYVRPANAVVWDDANGKAVCEDANEAIIIAGYLIQDGAKKVVCIKKRRNYVVKYKYE